MIDNTGNGQGEAGGDIPSSLVKLQSKDHEEILNIIDQLRSEGISKYVNLPQLIVCGDQSSGKSSVLEAISGLSFPTRDNVCTRFATELILRRAPESGVTASIYPDDDRPSAEKDRLRNFKSPTLALDRFGETVEKAEEVMGVKKDGLSFSKDVLRVEVVGPTQPHLTLVDLPGLYHAPDESQTEEGVQFVESLVLSYMQNRRSVMLAVISGKSDIALQKVTSFTRKVDPNGERTIGIITKPDTIPAGSEMEQSFYNLAQNKRMPFRLGWHVLKNRTFEERHFSLAQRNESETAFLSRGIWSLLPRTCVGVDSLRPRLSTVLKDHILSQLPAFIIETQAALNDAESSLHKLGDPRQTLVQQRQYLLQGSERFSSIINFAIGGMYSDPFFGDAMTDDGYHKRVRAVIQNRLSDFAEAMRIRGAQREIVDDAIDTESRDDCITRSDFVKEVQVRMRRSRGRELPGTFSPLIIGDLFLAHSQPWEAIVNQYIDLVLGDIHRALSLVLKDVLDLQSSEGVLQHVLNPRMSEIERLLRAKAVELLSPHQSGHPITYNHYFVETIQKIREQRLRRSTTEKLKEFFGEGNLDSVRSPSFRMSALIEALGSQHSTDMEQFACSEAIDCMLAYYKVARKKFVDDFSSLAIEKCLLEPLLKVYCPRVVIALTDEIAHVIANEDESTTRERDRLREKAAILDRCLKKLHRPDLHRLAAKQTSLPQLNGTEENEAAVQNGKIYGQVDKISHADLAFDSPATFESSDGRDELEPEPAPEPELMPDEESAYPRAVVEEVETFWPMQSPAIKSSKKKKRNY